MEAHILLLIRLYHTTNHLTPHLPLRLEEEEKKEKDDKHYLLLAVTVCVCSTYHLIVSLNFDHQSKNESALSDSNNKKPLYSVPHACMYSPTSSIPEGKLFFRLCHSSLALSASSLLIVL